MGRVCARCHVRFPGRRGLQLYWCNVDRFYVCRRCWEEGCNWGHGRGRKGMRQAYTSAAIGGMMLLTAIFAPILGYFPVDAHVLTEWQQGPVTPIVNLHIGEEAKVRGILGSSSFVALGGAQRRGYAWSWNTSDVFTISDSSGTAVVTVAWTWLILPGPHLASWAVTSSGQPDYAATFYAAGDAATILGVVGPGAGAQPSISALVVGPAGASVSPPPLDYVLPILGATLLGVGWAWMLASVADHALVHRRKMRGVRPQAPSALDQEKDASVEWYPNPRWMNVRPRLYGGLLAGMGVGLGLDVAVYAFVPTGLIPFMLVAFGAVMLGGSFYTGTYLWIFQAAAPSAVAFSDRGFHLWYDSVYDRELHDSLIPWDSLETVTVVPLPKGGKAWMMRRKDGEVDNLGYLTVANRNSAVSAWELHRPRTVSMASAAADVESPIPRDDARVLLRRGANFQFSLMLLIFGGLFGGFLVVRGLTLDPTDPFYPSEMAGDILIGGVFDIIFLVGLVGAFLTRRSSSLVVDQESVQLFRGDDLIRNISWAHVTKVGCGLKMTRAVSYFIDVYGRPGQRPIRVNSWVFRVKRDDLADAGEVLLRTARARGIPAEEYAIPGRTP